MSRPTLPRAVAARLVAAALAGAAAGAAGPASRPAAPASQPATAAVDAAGPLPPMVTSAAGPDAAAAADVDRLVAQLSDADPDVRDDATDALGHQAFFRLPLVEAQAARGDLPPEAAARFGHLMPALRCRARLAAAKADRQAVLYRWRIEAALWTYDHGGNTSPKWDRAARAFLVLANYRGAVWGADDRDVVSRARLAFDKATEAGCDDPVVLACGGLLLADTGGTPPAVADLFARADAAATDDHTPPFWRILIDGRVLRAGAAAGHPFGPDVAGRLQRMIANVPRVTVYADLPAVVGDDVADNVVRTARAVRVKLDPVARAVLDPLVARYPADAGAFTLQGRLDIDAAWEARGRGFADTVTPQGWRDFRAELDAAAVALTRAWELDPGLPDAPTQMITVALGQDADRSVLEQWFARAMAADPDDLAACRAKLSYLQPRWHGSAEELLAFGRECAAGGNWRAGLPLVLADAHQDVAADQPDPAAYFLRSGVWDDLQSVYAGTLRRFPDDDPARNAYAAYAVKCHQWKVADAQFRSLAGRCDPARFGDGTRSGLDAARDRAARLADQPDEQGR